MTARLRTQTTVSQHSSIMGRWLLAGLAGFTLASCTPPALRAAHSIDKGEYSFEGGAAIDSSTHKAEVLTMTGDDTLAIRQRPQPDFGVVFGLGRGLELGFGSRLLLKYSILDERRHTTPLSIAVAGTSTPSPGFAGSGPLINGSGGVLFSSHLQLTSQVALRPIANIWYSSRSFPIQKSLTGTDLADDNGVDAKHQFLASVHYQGIDLPIGLELPVKAGDDWALTPTLAFTAGIPIAIEVTSARCVGCLFGLDKVRTGVPMSVYAGVRFQPLLNKTSEATPPAPQPQPAPEAETEE